jgi:hypothetical protein
MLKPSQMALPRSDVLKVLQHFRLAQNLRPAGDFLSGPCPLHDGIFDVFYINPTEDRWECRGPCHSSGNCTALVARIQHTTLGAARDQIRSILEQ